MLLTGKVQSNIIQLLECVNVRKIVIVPYSWEISHLRLLLLESAIASGHFWL